MTAPDPTATRAALTPIVRAAVLDAFKLGVGHVIGVIEDRLDSDEFDLHARCVLDSLTQGLRAYSATVTYEDLP